MLAQQLINGLSVGLAYGLLALGFSLMYSTTRVINFAHGDIFVLGALTAIVLERQAHLPFLAASVVATVLVAAGAALFARLVLRRLQTALERSVATIALALALRDGMLIAFGSDSMAFMAGVQGPGRISLGGVAVTSHALALTASALVFLAMVYVLISRTRFGIEMRATAQDLHLAATSGVNILRVEAAAFSIGAAAAVTAAVLIGPAWQFNYATGTVIGVKAFTAAMLGGLGRMEGAFLGGLLLGVAEALFAGYFSSGWKDLVVYLLLLAVLLFFPQGVLQPPARRLA